MSRKDKLVARILTIPKDFTYDEAEALLAAFGFREMNKGKTSGSRVKFLRNDDMILLHKPHPRKVLPIYAVKQIVDKLKECGDLL